MAVRAPISLYMESASLCATRSGIGTSIPSSSASFLELIAGYATKDASLRAKMQHQVGKSIGRSDDRFETQRVAPLLLSGWQFAHPLSPVRAVTEATPDRQ
jgi:hypothetical protein